VPLIGIDRNLLQRCLAHKPKAWREFVDRFMGLVVHVVNHSAQSRSVRLTREDRDDLVGEVFLAIVKDDFAVLRRFRGECSLATYLAVVARRVVVHELVGRKSPALLGENSYRAAVSETAPDEQATSREEVQRLIEELDGIEAAIVRMYHLEGKSYREISATVGIAENSVGPMLTRARSKMRKARAE
jgi:RNA polymerase sigma-70 factor (ECF subfamily)